MVMWVSTCRMALCFLACIAFINVAALEEGESREDHNYIRPYKPPAIPDVYDIPGGVSYVSVNSGVFVTCGVATTGEAYCSGNNDDGAVGDGTQQSRLQPTEIYNPGHVPWRQVSSGDWHSCGTKEDNTGYCWGYNGGRLGLGNGPDVPVQATTPQKLNGTWTFISAGHFHSCGLNKFGKAFCWGNNKNGRLGNGEISEEEVYEWSPVPVKGGPGEWIMISAKGSHTCGIGIDNTAWCWGGNEDGEVGNGIKSLAEPMPVKLPGEYKKITSGLRFSCGIKVDNQLFCWGAMRSGGQESVTEDFGPDPKRVGAKFNYLFKTIEGGMEHACGIIGNNQIRCFGLGWHGQIGNGLDMTMTEPYAPSCTSDNPCSPKGNETWLAVSTGEYYSCGIKKADSQMYCFGENSYGQLGSGIDTLSKMVYDPTPVLTAQISTKTLELLGETLDAQTAPTPAPEPLIVAAVAPSPVVAMSLSPPPAPIVAPQEPVVEPEPAVEEPVPPAAPAPVELSSSGSTNRVQLISVLMMMVLGATLF